MNPFQKHPRNSNQSSTQSLSLLLKMIELLQLDLEKYKLSDKANQYIISKNENLITLLMNFIDSVEKESEYNLEVIKKQALIIEAANIKYPTIHQSLGHIYEIFLASKGRVRELGFPHNPSVSIKVI